MLNMVALMGRLVADPEMKHTQSGRRVVSVRLAVDRSYVKPGEERKADFFDVVAWEGTAEFICKWFGKGSPLYVDGVLQTRAWTDKQGQNRVSVEVLAREVGFAGPRPGAHAAEGTTATTTQMPRPQRPAQTGMTDAYTQAAAPAAMSSDGFAVIDDSEDLPF